MSAEDLSGRRFGRLLVEVKVGSKPTGIVWRCRCDCGNTTEVVAAKLRNGHTSSCGCLGLERRTAARRKHGQTGSPEYVVWNNMIQRCTNRKVKSYADYGARGIRVCARWLDFRNFLADMGEKPRGLTLERKDVNGDYEPNNCLWVDRRAQANNRRSNRFVTINGRIQTVAEWAVETGLNAHTVRWRAVNGRVGDDVIKP